MPAEKQLELMGESSAWFIKEDARKYSGANYLLGLAIYCVSYDSLWDLMDPDTAELDELQSVLRRQIDGALYASCRGENTVLAMWHVDSLKSLPIWETVRRYAVAILDVADLHVNPPKQPFAVETMIEID